MMAAHAPRSETGPIMKASHFVGSRLYAAYALGAVALGAVVLSALGSFVPDEALSALRSWIPREAPFLELLLLGWVGVALGRLTIRRDSSAAQHGGQATRRREAGAKEEKVERILRHVAKVLQAQVTDSESFSERLDGASERLSRQEAAGQSETSCWRSLRTT